MVGHRLLDESGLSTLLSACTDTHLLCAQRFVRMTAYSGSTMLLVAHLSNLGNSDRKIGLFMTLTLWGDIVISLILTLCADRLGRRTVLSIGSLMMMGSGLVFATSENFTVLVLASVFGVISPGGDEIGPFRAIEESTLAHITAEHARTDIFGWYTMMGTAGQSFGLIPTGWIVNALLACGMAVIPAYKCVFYGYAALGFLKLVLTYAMTSKVEAVPIKNQAKGISGLIPKFRRSTMSLALQLCILFGLDSFASGMVSLSWLTYFFQKKFNIEEGTLGTLFSVALIVSAVSILVSSSISKRLGNVKTMVFTHLPSTIALAMIPLPSTLGPSIVLLVFRNSFKSMDTAPRAAFLAAVLPPDERTAIIGTINVCKTLGQSMGPLITGVLSQAGYIAVSFFLAGGIKAFYDLAFLFLFAHKESDMVIRAKESFGSEEEVGIGLLEDGGRGQQDEEDL